MERKLGRTSRVVTQGSGSRIKLEWDSAYDIPLIASLHQQLSDENILNEVRIITLYMYNFLMFNLLCMLLYFPACG